jgi:hypothetical protein
VSKTLVSWASMTQWQVIEPETRISRYISMSKMTGYPENLDSSKVYVIWKVLVIQVQSRIAFKNLSSKYAVMALEIVKIRVLTSRQTLWRPNRKSKYQIFSQELLRNESQTIKWLCHFEALYSLNKFWNFHKKYLSINEL